MIWQCFRVLTSKIMLLLIVEGGNHNNKSTPKRSRHVLYLVQAPEQRRIKTNKKNRYNRRRRPTRSQLLHRKEVPEQARMREPRSSYLVCMHVYMYECSVRRRSKREAHGGKKPHATRKIVRAIDVSHTACRCEFQRMSSISQLRCPFKITLKKRQNTVEGKRQTDAPALEAAARDAPFRLPLAWTG